MKTIKRPYTPVCDLELVPVECISDFAVILPRAFIAVRDDSYRIPVIPGSFTPGVESEQADSGTIYYNVGHTFEVALTGPDSQELLSALSLQDLVAIYTNDGKLQFSKSASRLFFGTSPEPRQKDTLQLAENRPNVQVWSWDEPVQYTVQDYNSVNGVHALPSIEYSTTAWSK